MKKTVFMDRYPIYSIELSKEEIKVSSADEAVEYFKEKIQNHPIAKFITVFEHYSHTKELGGEIMDGLIDAKNIIFCFGQAIPNTKILALRPRSIAVCEFEDKFVIDFLEAPKEEMHTLMENWAKGLKR
ncbi:DUF6858 family protein [Sulfurimonas sp.]|uniref:DUF6858 family protein n=1 Tax=Sulfurimonas sp. TaxID=2022749 RepID=UPI0025DA9236|nr:hypothetical protein [Sulfurimonas sp.]MBW6489031.1 hypothetical protein [Sulfurimonas sp.]